MGFKKFYRPIIIVLLLAGSTIAMMELKPRWENAGLAGEDVTFYKTFFWLSLNIFLCTLGYVVISWFFSRWKEYRMLKNQRIETELSVLKSKIDPHFFFNTLNNLYGLAREKSKETPDVILKLSEIMRYVIYEGEKERVPLKEEVEYLERYLELHRIRYHSDIELVFDSTVDNWDIEIAPLLLVILIENAIKHGVEMVPENAYLKASLKVSEGLLTFNVKNNHNYVETSSDGLGLKNMKRRLELLYPQKHTFIAQKIGDEFDAKLEIDLT